MYFTVKSRLRRNLADSILLSLGINRMRNFSPRVSYVYSYIT